MSVESPGLLSRRVTPVARISQGHMRSIALGPDAHRSRNPSHPFTDFFHQRFLPQPLFASSCGCCPGALHGLCQGKIRIVASVRRMNAHRGSADWCRCDPFWCSLMMSTAAGYPATIHPARQLSLARQGCRPRWLFAEIVIFFTARAILPGYCFLYLETASKGVRAGSERT